MITTIAEHSVDLDLLPEKANILDLGCRGFLFANDLILKGHNVITVDADNNVKSVGSFKHYTLAISDHNEWATVVRSSDPQATRINKKTKLGKGSDDVKCYTLKSFCDLVQITFFDLIKIDIEGSEREVIMSMGKTYAKQLSIEFHCHTGIYGDAQVKEMEDKLLSLGYFPVKHDKTSQHGMGLNFWDSLWILHG